MAFPDANALLIAYLTPLVDPVPVVSRVPDPRPPLVQVRRVGGAALMPVRDTARLDVLCWEATDLEAMDLALTVRAAVWALQGTSLLGGVPCYRVQEFLSPRLNDDPVTNSPRAWATYALDLRADDVVPPAAP